MRIRKQNNTAEEGKIQDIASVSDALAHPTRIRIYRYILTKNSDRIPVRNKDIVNKFSCSQATISQHLTKLIIGGLVTAKQDGTSTYYYINIGAIEEYIKELRVLA